MSYFMGLNRGPPSRKLIVIVTTRSQRLKSMSGLLPQYSVRVNSAISALARTSGLCLLVVDIGPKVDRARALFERIALWIWSGAFVASAARLLMAGA